MTIIPVDAQVVKVFHKSFRTFVRSIPVEDTPVENKGANVGRIDRLFGIEETINNHIPIGFDLLVKHWSISVRRLGTFLKQFFEPGKSRTKLSIQIATRRKLFGG